MFCVKCGKEIKDNINFCNYCGASQHLKAENLSNSISSNSSSKPQINNRKTHSSYIRELKLVGLITVTSITIAIIIQRFGSEISNEESSPVSTAVSETIKQPFFRPGATYLMDYSLGDYLRKQMGSGAEDIINMDREGTYEKYHAFIFDNSSGVLLGDADKKSRMLSDAEQGNYTIDYANKTVQLSAGTGATSSRETLSFTHDADGMIITLTSNRGYTYRLQNTNYTLALKKEDSYDEIQAGNYDVIPDTDEQKFVITNETELMMYLDNRTYIGPNGIEIQFKLGNIYVDGLASFFNLSYNIISPSVAHVRGESTTNPDETVNLRLNTKTRCISISGVNYCEMN